MAGGPTTLELVAAANATGAFAFLAGAYRTAAELDAEIREASRRVAGAFGVNIFVPGRPTVHAARLARYVGELEPEATHLGVDVGQPRWEDDDWDAKIQVLTDAAPAIASFTFGCPPKTVVEALQSRDSLVMVTVTNVDEADVALAAGADMLCAQGIEAGAHRATFDDTAPDDELPTVDLVHALTARTRMPVIAAGGVATPADVRKAIEAGAAAVQAGTAFLRSDEAGTNPVHRAALRDTRIVGTALTRAFTGRRARGLVNGFMQRHPSAPSAFPEIHHATRPLRAAAVDAGDAERLHLWAGTGYQHARAAPAAAIVEWLLAEAQG